MRHAEQRHAYEAAPRARPMGVGLDLSGRRRDGSEVPVEISLSPIETLDGVLVAASIRDIGERLAVASALRAERDRVTAVIEGLGDGLLEFDPLAGSFVRVNRSFCELVGYSADDVLAASQPPPWWPEDCRAANLEARRRILDGVASRVEMTLQHTSGHRFPAAVTASTIPAGADADRFILTFHDLTDERRMAAELAAAHAAVEVADDRDRIARDLHDGVIQRLFAAGLRLQAALSRPDMRDRVLSVIDDLDAAITEIRGAIFTLHRPRDVTSGFETTLRVSAAEAERLLGHQPNVRLDGDLHAVPSELVYEATSVVRELLANVAKHAAASTTRLEVVVDTDLTVVVEDDGIGIDTATPPAAGDGLRNVRERAARCDGRVVISSGAIGGTRVEWTVPLKDRHK
jgi:PAS domain S-box-containing protein